MRKRPRAGCFTLGRAIPVFLLAFLSLSCVTQDTTPAGSPGTPIDMQPGQTQAASLDSQAQILKDVRNLLEIGSPASLESSIEKLSSSEAGKSELGREYGYIADLLLEHAYPLVKVRSAVTAPSPGSPYPAMAVQVGKGEAIQGLDKEENLLKTIIGCLVVLTGTKMEIRLLGKSLLERALTIRPDSVILTYLKGYLSEMEMDASVAAQWYEKALLLDSSCYPADLGLARIEIKRGEFSSGYDRLLPFLEPGGVTAGKADPTMLSLAAEALYGMSFFEDAHLMVNRALESSQDGRILFLRVKILIALGSFGQADRLLQIVEKQYPQDVEVLLVRIRLEEAARGYKAALAYAETGSAALNENQEFKETYARLLFEDDNKEKARALLYDILTSAPNRISALVLLLKDALDQKNWEQADIFADRIIGLGKDYYGADVLELAIQAAFGRGLTAKALTLAEELYATNPRQLSVALPYIQSLIGAGQTVKAAGVIDELLPLAQSGPDKSRLLFLKSGTAPNRESRIQTLQQALFEDLSNIDALTAISDAYAAAGELRTALRYLRQAAALSPGNAELSAKLLNLEARLAQ